MLVARVYRESLEVSERLKDFGPSRSDLIDIVRAVVAARADAIEDDPASAEGLFAYIFGTRYTRQAFKKYGYLRHRQDNIESVRHPEHDLRVIYQSVDLAADRLHQPKAISGKGAGSDRLISASQGSLFTEEDLIGPKVAVSPTFKTGTWFFCVSVEGDNVRAELSLPSNVKNGNFGPFIERIFIVRDGEWAGLNISPNRKSEAAEFEPVITRK